MISPTLVCFLEELSAREMLAGVLARILPTNWNVQYIVFEGKQDLLRRLQMRIRGWQLPNSFFLVLCDQDAQDCTCWKSQIAMMLLATGKTTKIRIACHELENSILATWWLLRRGFHVRALLVWLPSLFIGNQT